MLNYICRMLNNIKLVLRYFKYLLKSKRKVDSSFVMELYEEAIISKRKYYCFEEIEGIREALKKNSGTINITDFGAGSRINTSNQRKIADVAKNSAKAPNLGQIMFRLINHFKPNTLLELGTSLGISACYQFGANRKGKFITMEGCPETAKVAQKVFDSFNAKEIEIVVGDFNQTLPQTIENFTTLDYAFFDGNHQKEPTINYFNEAVKKANENSLFIFDDIHWSSGMEEAWETIKKHPDVSVTIDLFWIGLVFFKKDEPKADYILRA